MGIPRKGLTVEKDLTQKQVIITCIWLMQKLVLSPAACMTIDRLSQMTEKQLQQKLDALWEIVKTKD